MSVIKSIIPPQSFELVRNRIGVILTDELSNQYQLSNNVDLDLNYFLERFIPFDKTELPAINVTLERGEFGGQTAIQSDGTYRFNIDCYTSAKNTESERGDSMAMLKLHSLLGKCRSILEDPQYKTLGFAAPFIMNRHYESISIANPTNQQDALSTVMGRLTLVVKVPETSVPLVPSLLSGYQTNVKIGLTDKGYIFLPPGTGGSGSFSEEFDFSFNK